MRASWVNRMPWPYCGPLPAAIRKPGWSTRVSQRPSTSTDSVMCGGRKPPSTCSSATTYPPCARNQRDCFSVRRFTAASRPVPAMAPKNTVRAASRSASARRRNCDCIMRPPNSSLAPDDGSRCGPSGTKCNDSSDSPCQGTWSSSPDWLRSSSGSMVPRSMQCVLSPDTQKRRHAASACSTLSMPMECAKSLALPSGTISVGICLSANPPR